MEIDQRIVLGVALVALLISIFSYKEVLDMRCLITGGTPTPDPIAPPCTNHLFKKPNHLRMKVTNKLIY